MNAPQARQQSVDTELTGAPLAAQYLYGAAPLLPTDARATLMAGHVNARRVRAALAALPLPFRLTPSRRELAAAARYLAATGAWDR